MKKLLFSLGLLLFFVGQSAVAGTVTYVYTDPQGTPLAEANATGTITAKFDYAPYGAAVTSLGTAPDGPGYTGHVNDPESGFVYMQARYYDPAVGRFLSADPIEIGAKNGYSFNRYDYAFNNPLGSTDPSGAYPQMTGSQINCEVYRCNTSGDNSSRQGQLAIIATGQANKALKKAGILGTTFKNLKPLITGWANIVVPITVRLQVEIGSDIMFKKDSGYLSSPAYSTGERITISQELLSNQFIPGLIAEIHTHPDNVGFSGASDWAKPFQPVAVGDGDLAVYYNAGVDGYVALPNGAIYGWADKSFVNNMNRSGTPQLLGNSIFSVRGK